ncbi:MAG TPA: protein kinase [Fibrobacteria bacterium]|nr:protein kinase [Fibrobacteria bacterium]
MNPQAPPPPPINPKSNPPTGSIPVSGLVSQSGTNPLTGTNPLNTATASSLLQVQVGGRLGKYVILSELGRGGMAVVFKAHQPDLDRLVAIKVLFGTVLQQRFVERFQAEARSVAKMNHPNVIRIFEVGEQNGVHYLVMEYIQGMDLLAFLHEKKPSFNEVVEIVNQVSEALAYCHRQGIIHRDLKPTNILMRGTTPIVIDFGLAKAVDPNLNVTLTLSGEVVGSPAYMSPEQAMGQSVGTHSDICAVGIIMYELISFKNPYLDPRSLHQTALNAIKAEPVPLRHLSPWLDSDFAAIVTTCMAKEIKDRYQSIELLLKDLYSYRNGLPIMAKPPSALNLAWRFVKANPILYLGAGFLLVMTAIVFGFLSVQEESKKAPWGLVQEELFNKTDSSLKFLSFDRMNGAWVPSESWKVARGRLEAFSSGQSFAVANQEFFGDLKIEFTVKGLNGSNNDFNAFLFGATPDDAFRFSLGEWGTSVANIEYGKTARYSFNTEPVKLNGGIVYKVTIEKEDNVLQLFLDDVLLVRKYYTLPVKVERSSKFGFYTWNSSLAIDDLRVYKKAVALSAKPTVVADAYLEEGFITNSIPAYKHVIEAYPNKSISFEARMKMGESFMVLKNYQGAIQNLTLAASNSKDPKIIPEALFQLAQCYFYLGKAGSGYDKLKLLPANYPESDFNNMVVQSRVEAVYQCLNSGENIDLCAARMIDEFRFLIQAEDARRNTFGEFYTDMAEIFRRLGQPAPMQNAQHLLTYFQESDGIICSLRLILARYYLGVRDPARANFMVQSAPQGDNVDRGLKAEKDFLTAQMAFLEGKNSQAAELYGRTYRQFNSVNGMAFKCILHSMVIKSIADIPVLPADRKLYLNGAASRKERMQMAYLADKIPEDYFRRGVPAGFGPPESLEDMLVYFLKVDSTEGPYKAAAYLEAGLARFPASTFEYRYLEFLLKRYREEKRV